VERPRAAVEVAVAEPQAEVVEAVSAVAEAAVPQPRPSPLLDGLMEESC
jgi:hypothetical protein